MLICAVLVLMVGCKKDRNEQERTFVGLTFTETNTPATAMVGEGIVSDVKCYGEDLCYQFAGFDMVQSGVRQVDIRAIATYPTDNTACAEALYQVDTTVRVNPLATGQYILRFFNGNTLFDADTVQVN